MPAVCSGGWHATPVTILGTEKGDGTEKGGRTLSGSRQKFVAIIGMNEEFIKLFGRHIVSMGWLDQTRELATENDGRGRNFCTSGFVVSIRGIWFLITAGHILDGLEEALRKGHKLTDFHVHDGWGPVAFYNPQIFDYVGAKKYYYNVEHESIDCAAIRLDENTRARIAANGVIPLDESGWYDSLPEEFDRYFVVGLPSMWQSTRSMTHSLSVSNALVLFDLERITEPPENFTSSVPRFYGKAVKTIIDDTGSPLTDFDGMSGSPIFATKLLPNGKNRYWVLAIQSSVDPETKSSYVAGNFFRNWALYLATELVRGGE